MTKQHCENYSSFIGSSDIYPIYHLNMLCAIKRQNGGFLTTGTWHAYDKSQKLKTHFWTIFAWHIISLREIFGSIKLAYLPFINEVPVQCQAIERSCICVLLWVSILPLSTILQWDFGNVPMMWYFFVRFWNCSDDVVFFLFFILFWSLISDVIPCKTASLQIFFLSWHNKLDLPQAFPHYHLSTYPNDQDIH